jgi:hypothetical protein
MCYITSSSLASWSYVSEYINTTSLLKSLFPSLKFTEITNSSQAISILQKALSYPCKGIQSNIIKKFFTCLATTYLPPSKLFNYCFEKLFPLKATKDLSYWKERYSLKQCLYRYYLLYALVSRYSEGPINRFDSKALDSLLGR